LNEIFLGRNHLPWLHLSDAQARRHPRAARAASISDTVRRRYLVTAPRAPDTALRLMRHQALELACG